MNTSAHYYGDVHSVRKYTTWHSHLVAAVVIECRSCFYLISGYRFSSVWRRCSATYGIEATRPKSRRLPLQLWCQKRQEHLEALLTNCTVCAWWFHCL